MSSALSKKQQQEAAKKSQPDWMEPSLAKLTKKYFSDPDWLFERKLDGLRCLVFKKGSEVELLSRNKKLQNDFYPELVEALKKQEPDFIADGEVVTFKDDVSSFSLLQNRMNEKDPDEELLKRVPVTLYLFDCMFIDGYDISSLNNRERKSILKKGLEFYDPIRYLPHVNENGKKYHQEACQKGWEGIIAKDAGKPYAHSRTSNWLKFKCVNRQEFVIGGFTEPEGSRVGFGAILIGFYEGDKLRYAGKVGTGFSDQELEEIHSEFHQLERKTSPFADEVDEDTAHWITPKVIAEIGFTEWTNDDKLRHPRFLGLRPDKSPSEVVKEEAE
ncbi:non-homologous end-joining DNA ligase [Halocola ammonii]